MPRLLLAILCATLIANFGLVVFTPHQLYFEQHKSEYEYQIELIQQGNSIDYFGNLGIEVTCKSHAIVFGYLSDDLYLSSYAYVYAEKYSDLDDVAMCNDITFKGGRGKIYATLSTHWYLCYRIDDW